ncbi:HlyD family type I secretion periplasmic adaptor subunit [uncultured Selenomonas sp.]|uniref:HlyD family type I secretion periplasmic adaptor subunit n=1 Tax=uncultured Selenomonas sp. TaxID=159275 RepID=UPI0025DD0D32|nr:HlyD family type I secretion periplasmic adaptor subunit [uncultured Selenomonas sp.]
MKLTQLWKRFIGEDGKDAQETEFLPSILEVTETPTSPVGRAVLWTLVALLIAGGIWICVGEVDEVAVANGKVTPVGNVKIVQSQNKGAIKELDVKEGDYVEEGQTLVVLDTTKTQADVDQLKKQAAYYGLTVARLNAEMQDAPFTPPQDPEGLLEQKDIDAQVTLYQSRRAKLAADQEKNGAAVAQASASVEGSQAQLQKYRALQAVAQEKEDRLEELMQEDAISYFQLLEARATRVEYQRNAEATEKSILEQEGKLTEAQDLVATTDTAYRQDTMSQLVEAKRQYNAIEEELKKADDTNQQSVIVAPISGRVNQLAVHTLGGVVSEGQAVMMIVPDDAVMEIEAYADNKDIGFIQQGQTAEVKVETFNFQKYGMVNATVDEISPDAGSNVQDKETYQKYRLTLGLENDDSGIELTPGMNVTAEIKIKKKKIIDFFLDPFRKYKDEALRER